MDFEEATPRMSLKPSKSFLDRRPLMDSSMLLSPNAPKSPPVLRGLLPRPLPESPFVDETPTPFSWEPTTPFRLTSSNAD